MRIEIVRSPPRFVAKRLECGQLAAAFEGVRLCEKAPASREHSKRFARFGCGSVFHSTDATKPHGTLTQSLIH
jgi:hypothetical protein